MADEGGWFSVIRRCSAGLSLALVVLALPALAGAELAPEAERNWNQARSLINQGLQSNAIHPLKRAVQLAGDHVPLHCDYQDLMLAQGFSVDLVEEYKARRDRSPKEPNWHYLYGRATGDPALAKKAFARALQLDPKHKWATQGLGGVAAVEGRLDDALEQYRAALVIDPAFAQVHNKIAGIYYAKGDYAAAKLAWKAAMEHAPDDHHAYLVTPEHYRRLLNERTTWRWPSRAIVPSLHRVDVAFRSRDGGAALLRLKIMNPGRGANFGGHLTAGQLLT